MAAVPSLSVIVPTFDRAAFAGRCVRSLRRSGISDLEVIVVDDGGSDAATQAEVLAAGAIYLRQANAGPAAARNRGFAASRGRYLAFLDDDDTWTTAGGARLVDLLDANPDVALVFGDSRMGNETDGRVSFVDRYGGAEFHGLPHEPRPGGLRVLERSPFFRRLSFRNLMFLGSVLIRREFFEQLGGFDAGLRGAADWELCLRAAAAGVIAYAEGPAVSCYDKHSGGLSKDRDHMGAEFVRALDSVRRRAVLGTEDRRHLDECLRSFAFGWASHAFDRGDFVTARNRLRHARELGQFRGREAAWFAASFLPPPLLGALRRATRA